MSYSECTAEQTSADGYRGCFFTESSIDHETFILQDCGVKTFLTLDSSVQVVSEKNVVFFVKSTCEDVKRVASIINDLDTNGVSQNPLSLSLGQCFLLYDVLPLHYPYYEGNDDSE